MGQGGWSNDDMIKYTYMFYVRVGIFGWWLVRIFLQSLVYWLRILLQFCNAFVIYFIVLLLYCIVLAHLFDEINSKKKKFPILRDMRSQ